jgi:hypothetical protein
MLKISALGTLVLVAFFGLTAAAQVIDTRPADTTLIFDVGPFGEQYSRPTFGFATIGQTFRAPTGYLELDRFTFWLKSRGGEDGTDFAAYISEWDPVAKHLLGVISYSSPMQTLGSAVLGPIVPFTFETSKLLLDPSKLYIAFLSTSKFMDGIEGYSGIISVGADTYSGGGAYVSNNKGDFDLLATKGWLPLPADVGSEFQFRAEFSAIPEPGTYGLVGCAGLVFIALWRRRIGARIS